MMSETTTTTSERADFDVYAVTRDGAGQPESAASYRVAVEVDAAGAWIISVEYLVTGARQDYRGDATTPAVELIRALHHLPA